MKIKSIYLILLMIFLLGFDLLAQESTDCSFIDTNLCYISVPFPSFDFEIEKLFESEAFGAVYQTPLLADIDGDCIPEIIIAGTNGLIEENPRITKDIVVLNSRTGQTLFTIPTEYYSWYSLLNFAIADIDNDGIPEIILAAADHPSTPANLRRRLICYNLDGTIKWVSSERIGSSFGSQIGGTVGIADFNKDGIPEVYVFNEIFNARTGVKLIGGGNNGKGFYREQSSLGVISLSLAADLDDDPSDLELAAGYTVYKVEINNINGISGNSMTPINFSYNGEYIDGLTSIADINNDGKLDVLISTYGNQGQALLYAYTMENNNPTLIASTNMPSNGGFINQSGVPMFGIVDNTGTPSILISRGLAILHYKYNGTQEFQLIWNYITNDGSGETGMTLFDFNQNGVNEIVYRDEEYLRIINGSVNPPVNLASFNCKSGTGFERPIVGDIDKSGSTKICVMCSENFIDRHGRLAVFGAPKGKQQWAPSRSVWNQYAYHIFNINDDLTVPQYQLNNASYASGAYNNIYVQASMLDEDGNYLSTAASLSGVIKCINYDPYSDQYTIIFDIINAPNASKEAISGIPVSFYSGNPETTGKLLGVYFTLQSIMPGNTLSDQSITITASELSDLYMVLNTFKSTNGEFTGDDFYVPECNYDDNFFSTINLPHFDTLIVSICEGESYDFYGTQIADGGNYHHIFVDQNGCDSILTLQLMVISPEINQENIKLCPGDSIQIAGSWIMEDATVEEFFTAHNGCDSINITQIELLSEPEEPHMAIDCENRVINLHIEVSPDWQIQWDNGSTSSHSAYKDSEEATITLKALEDCERQFRIQLPQIPDITLLKIPSDTLIHRNETLTLDLGLNTTEWDIEWFPAAIVDCNTCSRVNIDLNKSTDITIKLTHFTGCEYELFFRVRIEKEKLIIPNVFAPDGDGINDKWNIKIHTGIDLIQCKIFDRWGSLVYSVKGGNHISWDGSFRGQKAMTGVYVFVLEYFDEDNIKQTITGDITLLR